MPQKPKRVNSHALGAFIRTQMAKKRISYAILVDNARRSGHTISRSWAGAIGQGKKEFPSMAALEAIAAGLGIPAATFRAMGFAWCGGSWRGFHGPGTPSKGTG